MEANAWIKSFPAAMMVCDCDGIIIEMNDMAAQTHANDGGYNLIGSNMMQCHSEESRAKLGAMFEEQHRNVYTIEKNGVKKLIYQSPWYADGVFSGFVELSLEIPFDMPHFIRASTTSEKIKD